MGFTRQVLDPGILDPHLQTHARGGGTQKGAFLGRGLVQGHRQVRPHRRQHQARETGAGTQIGQGAGLSRDQGSKLGAIPEVPPPEIGKGAAGHQIVPFIPVQQQIGIGLEPGQCFT